MLPQTHRVTLGSSTSAAATSSRRTFIAVSTTTSVVKATFSFVLRFPRPLVAAPGVVPFGGVPSPTLSSISSCLRRLLRPLLLEVDNDGRCPEFSLLVRGGGCCWFWLADSETGDSGDLLLDTDCAERRPDLRVSLGERGGPIGDGFAIVEWRGGNVIDVGGVEWLVRGCHTVKEYKYSISLGFILKSGFRSVLYSLLLVHCPLCLQRLHISVFIGGWLAATYLCRNIGSCIPDRPPWGLVRLRPIEFISGLLSNA